MTTKKSIMTFIIPITLFINTISANDINGAWHLRVLDGMEVRKARAILDFDMEKMTLSGFDACNRIGGTLIENGEHNTSIPVLRATRMACRQKIHIWVSKRLHTVLKEGFFIREESKYGVEGMTIRSPSHTLFLKRMER